MTNHDFPLTSTSSCPDATMAPSAGLSILVTENDPCAALLLEQAFVAAGVRVPIDFVDDAQDALAYLCGNPPFSNRLAHPLPTLLLLDFDLLGDRAFDVLKRVRHPRNRIHPLVVMWAGRANPGKTAQAYALGVDAFLVKPSNSGDLAETAEQLTSLWLEKNSAQAA